MRLEVKSHGRKVYKTYVSSNAIWSQKQFLRQYRSSAEELDAVVLAAVAEFLCDRLKLRRALNGLGLFGKDMETLAERGQAASERLLATPIPRLNELFNAIAHRVELGEDQVSIAFRMLEVRRYLEWKSDLDFRGRPSIWSSSDARFDYVVAVRAVTAGRWPSLHINPRQASCTGTPDKKLVDLIRSARKAQRLVEENRELDLDALAKIQGCRTAQFARLIRLNYLAPDIVTAVFDGTQPPGLNRKMLLSSNVPTDWAIQRKLYGFPAPERAIDPRNLFGRGMWPSSSE